jgi:HK97 family phage prohead protease
METKDFKFQIKAVDDEGRFTGKAAVYDNVDLQGDKIQQGAFRHTLKMLGGEVPILWHHRMDMPIGAGRLVDKDRHLEVDGYLDLNIKQAQEAHSLMRQREGFKRPAVNGLSIGYETVKSDYVENVRVLKEVKLFEVSVVTVAANPKARITRVKASQEQHWLLQKLLCEVSAIKASLQAEGIEVDPEFVDQSLLPFISDGPGSMEVDPSYTKADDPNGEGGQSLESLLGDAQEFKRRLSNGGHRPQGAKD